MKQIYPRHLEFVNEAARAFEDHLTLETYMNKDGDLIALRFGLDRDCVKVYELGEPVGFFVQQVDVRVRAPRKQVSRFAMEMEEQLIANDHKSGWENCTPQYLRNQLEKNFRRLFSCKSHPEFRRRCSNIANYAMMLSDNDRREEAERADQP
ncbi:hypothetical protein ACTHPF_26730 [Paenibacillus sp. SAF-054]|uniref:hypothetical protein n=1 Tax=unclassified Paenibacillus TaxID=185978 RepID=UPI003F8014ED